MGAGGSRAKILKLPAGLGVRKGILNLPRKVRLGKVSLSSNLQGLP